MCTFSRHYYLVAYSFASGLITIILMLVMIGTVFFRFKQKAEVLVIPVATLFAFTQLRDSMPGAPDGFGMPVFQFLVFLLLKDFDLLQVTFLVRFTCNQI